MKRLEINIQSPAQFDSQDIHKIIELNQMEKDPSCSHSGQDFQYVQDQLENSQRLSCSNSQNSESNLNNNQQYQHNQFDHIQMICDGQGGNKKKQILEEVKRQKNGLKQTFDFLRNKNDYVSKMYNQNLENDTEVDRIIREVLNKKDNLKTDPKNQRQSSYCKGPKVSYSNSLMNKIKLDNKQSNIQDYGVPSHQVLVSSTNREVYNDNLFLYKQISKLQKKISNLVSKKKNKTQSQNFHSNRSIKQTRSNKVKSLKQLQLQKVMKKLQRALNMSAKLTQRIDFQKSKLTVIYSNLSISGSKIANKSFQRSLSKQNEKHTKGQSGPYYRIQDSKSIKQKKDKNINNNNGNYPIKLASERSGLQNYTYRVKSPSLIQANSQFSKIEKNLNLQNSSKMQSYNSPILKYREFPLNHKDISKSSRRHEYNQKNLSKDKQLDCVCQDKNQARKASKSRIYIKDQSYVIPYQNNPQSTQTKQTKSKVYLQNGIAVNLPLQQFNREWTSLQDQENRLIEKIDLNSRKIQKYQQKIYKQAIK